jgi:release factor glutamine methyltransferase
VSGPTDDGLRRLRDARVDNAANEWRWLNEEPRAADPAWLADAVQRRCAGEPLAYITGWQEFHSLRFEVTPDVLIPRPETEGIVDAVLARHAARPIAMLLDVGTGSGAIPVAVAAKSDIPMLMATDVSEPALQVALRNAAQHGVADRITFACGHLAEPSMEAGWDGAIDCLTANLPYVADGERDTLQREVQREPAQALFAGADGLDLIRELAQELPDLLAPGGVALFEVGHDQAEAVVAILTERGCVNVVAVDDLFGVSRIVRAERPA